jgi:hypothetical protein
MLKSIPNMHTIGHPHYLHLFTFQMLNFFYKYIIIYILCYTYYIYEDILFWFL